MEHSKRGSFLRFVAFSLYWGINGVQRAIAFFRVSVYRIFFLFVALGVFLGYYGPSLWERISLATFEGPNVLVKIYDERSKHFCVVKPFVVAMQPGSRATSEVVVTPSQEGQSYNLTLGRLPAGMRGAFDAPRGRAPQNVRLTLYADASVSPGSYTIIILYKEGRLPNNCQINVVVT